MTSRDELIRRYADASATPLPPAGLSTHTCGCGAVYLDTDGGLDAHDIVFGHRPYGAGPPTDPAGRGTSPTGHQSAAPQQPSTPDGVGRARDPTAGPGPTPDRDEEGK